MEIGVADSRGVELEEDLVWAWSWDLYIFNGNREISTAFADTSCTAGLWDVFVIDVLGLGAVISLSAFGFVVAGHGLLVLGEWVRHCYLVVIIFGCLRLAYLPVMWYRRKKLDKERQKNRTKVSEEEMNLRVSTPPPMHHTTLP